MRSRLIHGMFTTPVAGAQFAGNAAAQQEDEINPALWRPYWIDGEGPAAVATPYALTAADRQKFKGTFGVDLSQCTFDIENKSPSCKTPQGYLDKKCSCSIDWCSLTNNGLLFVYSEASDATETDLSFARVWSELKSKHEAKILFRGAFHFLRPGVSAETQARAFLATAVTIYGKKLPRLPPVADEQLSAHLIFHL